MEKQRGLPEPHHVSLPKYHFFFPRPVTRQKDFSRKKAHSKSHEGCTVKQRGYLLLPDLFGHLSTVTYRRSPIDGHLSTVTHRPHHKNVLILFLDIVPLIMSDEIVTSHKWNCNAGPFM
jgi:hypothetical protein